MRTERLVRWARFRVLVVSAVAVILLSVLLYLLTGGMFLHEHATLYLYVPDATGIGEGSPVRVNGILIGQVADVALSGSSNPLDVVRLTLTVDRDSLSMLPAGSYAELGTEDPVGDKFVDITSRGPGNMAPGSIVPYRGPTDMFKTLDIAQFEQNIRQIEAVLTDIETGKSRVGQFILGHQMYDDLVRQVSDIERSLHAATVATGSVGYALRSEELYQRIRAPLVKLDQQMAQIEAKPVLRDNAQYEKLVASAQDMRQTIAKIRASPLVQSDALYNELTRFTATLAQRVDEFNTGALMAAPQNFESLTGSLRELEKGMREFHQNPKKYFRFKIF